MVTEPIEDNVIMDPSNAAGPVFDKFIPAAERTTFATIELVGAECPFAGVVAPLKGSMAGEVVRTGASGGFEPVATGVLQTPQTLRFGEAQQATGGGAMTLGKLQWSSRARSTSPSRVRTQVKRSGLTNRSRPCSVAHAG
jgi:hypothetical protein